MAQALQDIGKHVIFFLAIVKNIWYLASYFVFIIRQDMRVVPDNEFEEGKSGNRDRESHKDSNGSEPMDTENGKMDS